MTSAQDARDRRAQQQRERRLANRVCGNCQAPATLMREWSGGRPISICAPCNELLDGMCWRSLIKEAPWCPANKDRRCEDCVPFSVNLMIVDADRDEDAGPPPFDVDGRVVEGEAMAIALAPREQPGAEQDPSFVRRVWGFLSGPFRGSA